MGGWYTCRSCSHEFHSGFFNTTWCPKCWGKFSQILGVLKKVVIAAVIIVVSMFILQCFVPGVSNRITNVATAALDTTTLFTYSKDAYLESIIQGRLEHQYYTIKQESPYYAFIISGGRIESAEPLGLLPVNVTVELRNVIRRGENVWVPASFYVGNKPQQAFILFPRDWEESVAEFDRDASVARIKNQYERTVKENFELMEVAPEDEKEYRERYNDYYKVSDMSGDNYFYALKTVKPQIDSIHSYYLNANNINMVILQTDSEWVRPEHPINQTEEEE